MKKRIINISQLGIAPALFLATLLAQPVCGQQTNAPATKPEIIITSVPTDAPGENMASDPIKGTVSGVSPQDYKVVIYAKGGDKWWVQPTAASPLTDIGNDGNWEAETHGGTMYAALLVKPSYSADATVDMVPGANGNVVAVAKKKPEKK